LDPVPEERNNPQLPYENDGTHPLVDHAAMFFKEAEDRILKTV
jgi:hypothetical protein